MDWLSASAVCRLPALYSSLLGKIEPFLLASRFLSVGATRKNICGMQEREKGGGGCVWGFKKKKEMTKGLVNTISSKCSSSFACCVLFTVEENMLLHHLEHV